MQTKKITFEVERLSDQALLLKIYQPAPWLWKTKDNELTRLISASPKPITGLIVDLSHLTPEDSSALTLGDYLYHSITQSIKWIALIGTDELEQLSVFVASVSKKEARGFPSLAQATQWLETKMKE